MFIDDQDWSEGSEGFDEGDELASFDDQDWYGALTLDGGDGDGDGDSDGDSDGDGDEEEKKLDCMSDVLVCAVENFGTGQSTSANNTVLNVMGKFANSALVGQDSLLKAWFVLIVSRNKKTGEPFYSSSSIYNSATPAQQNEIRQGITTWDAISDGDLWNDLADGLGDDSINSTALEFDLVSSFELTRVVTDAEHEAIDNYINSWTTAAFLALITGELVAKKTAEKMAKFMATFTVDGLGAPPFALGAQAVIGAMSAVQAESYADALEKCENGGEFKKCTKDGPEVEGGDDE